MKEINSTKKLLSLFSKREKRNAFILLLLSIVSAFFQALGVFSIFPFIDIIIDPAAITNNEFYFFFYQLFKFNSETDFMIFLGIIIFIIMVGSNVLAALTIWYKNKFVFNQNHKMSERLLKNYLEKDYQFFLNRNTSELAKNILDEVNILTQRYLLAIFDVIINGLILLFIVVTIIIVNPVVSLITIISLGIVYFIVNHFIKGGLRKRGIKRREANKERYKMANEALASIKITKVLGVEPFFLNRYSVNSSKFAKYNRYASIAGALPKYIIEAFAFGGLVLYLVVSLSMGSNILEIIPIVSILALGGYRMLPAIQVIYNSVSQIYYNKPILDKIYEDTFINLKTKKIKTNPNIKIDLTDKITISNLSFSYEGYEDKKILENINLEINKGEVVGFVGRSGAGKTTLIDILMGLLNPSTGNIKIDNNIINETNLKAWQHNIGYVPQEIYLSDDTIANNIAFGTPGDEIDLDLVKNAAKLASLDKFIEEKLELGYDTVVGERGVRLSGGERQRIGLARALYKNPKVLILDEATSSLDNITEKSVLKAIDQASKDRTVIMIAHRLTTLSNCDKIFDMENKDLIVTTYDKLMKK